MMGKIFTGKRKFSLFFVCTVFFAVLLSACALAACAETHTHTLQHHAAVSPTCRNAGNIEYWECTDCGKFYSDAAATAEITEESTVLAATGAHEWDVWQTITAATCEQAGERSHMCVICGTVETETVPAAHTLTAREAVAATCGSDGRAAHYYCSRCGKYFADESATQELSYNEDIFIPRTSEHVWTEWTEAVTDCTHGGTRTRSCTVCGRQESESVPAEGHTMTYHARVDATCGADGTAEYWECGKCGLLFTDPLGNAQITQGGLVIPATDNHVYGEWTTVEEASCTQDGSRRRECGTCGDVHTETLNKFGHAMEFIAAEEATCEAAGNIAHYHCGRCGLDFQDEAGGTAIEDVTVAKLDHDMTHHAYKAATCTTEGNIEYWSCSICGKNYSDEQGAAVAEETVIAPINHANKAHYQKVEASCTQDGNIEYYHCPDCGKYFDSDMAETQLSDVVISGGHALAYSQQVDATCGEEGVLEHWACDRCGLLFSDANGENAVTAEDLVIPVDEDGHDLVNHKCSICGYIQPEEEYATVTLQYHPDYAGRVSYMGDAKGDSQIVIPAYYMSESGEYVEVTSIGPNAFKDYGGDVIVIPGTVTTIFANAFDGCTAAVVFEGPTNMTTLNNNAFENYAGSMVILPEGLKNIGRVGSGSDSTAVFLNCTNLTYVYIPVSVEFICGSCFYGCGGFTIYYEGTQAQYDLIKKENYDKGNYGYTEQMQVPRPEVLGTDS